jgi:5-methylcytosine-specific restriction endonuclease McrA
MTTPYWGGRRRQRFAAEIARRQAACSICGQPIDYTLTYPDPDSFSVEHRIPKATRPDLTLDPANCFAAHLRCNQSRGDRDYRPGIGDTSTNW